MLGGAGLLMSARPAAGFRVLATGDLPLSLASLGIGGNGACTLVWEGVLDATGIGADQTLVQVDTGADANRIMARNLAANAAVQLTLVLATVVSGISTGNVTGAVAFKVAVAIIGDGSARASLNGAAVVASTGGPTSGLTTLRVMNNAVGNRPAVGTMSRLLVRPVVSPDALLRSLSA